MSPYRSIATLSRRRSSWSSKARGVLVLDDAEEVPVRARHVARPVD